MSPLGLRHCWSTFQFSIPSCTCFLSEMYTVLMATCAASVSIPEEQVLKCVELLLEKNARVNVYDKWVDCVVPENIHTGTSPTEGFLVCTSPPPPPLTSGISNLAPYVSLKNFCFCHPLPLGIVIYLPGGGGYGYYLELHILSSLFWSSSK